MSEHYDPVDLDAQDDAAAEVKTREQIALENEIGDLRKLMGNKHGRRVVYRLLDQAHLYSSSIRPDALQMAFAEGERNFGLRLMAKVTLYCGEEYLTMLQENGKS